MIRALVLSLLLSPVCAAQEIATLYASASWLLPDPDPDWEPWMADETIIVKFTVATEFGTFTFFEPAGLDELWVGSMCMYYEPPENGWLIVAARSGPLRVAAWRSRRDARHR